MYIHRRHAGSFASSFATDSECERRRAATVKKAEEEAVIINGLQLADSCAVYSKQMVDTTTTTVIRASCSLYEEFRHHQPSRVYTTAQQELMGPILGTARQTSKAAATAMYEVHSVLQHAISVHRETKNAILWDTDRVRGESCVDVGGRISHNCTHWRFEDCSCPDGKLGGYAYEGDLHPIEGGGLERACCCQL